MAVPSKNTKHYSCTQKERQKSRATVMKSATSSRKSAVEFLKKAGILDNKGNMSKYYR